MTKHYDFIGREIRDGDTVVSNADYSTGKLRKTSLQTFIVIGFTDKRVLVKDATTGKLTNRVPNRVIVVLFNHTDDRLV